MNTAFLVQNYKKIGDKYMNNLEQIQNENIDVLTVDSREVAEMMNVDHSDLLKKIDKTNAIKQMKLF